MIRLVAVGDICLGFDVKKTISEMGSNWLFEDVAPILSEGDIVFGNLECVISNHPSAGKLNTIAVRMSHAVGVVEAGFTVLNLANNHIMDVGPQGLMDTHRFLDSHGVSHIGTGINQQAARKPLIIEHSGVKIGFLGYADNSTGNQLGRDPGAQSNKPGIAILDEKKIRNDIEKLRKEVDIVVVSVHADIEFVEYPSKPRRDLSRRIVDYGADVLLQHHPHVVQGIERYRGALIAYSLGNFVFPVEGNQYMQENSNMSHKSFILKIDLNRRGVIHHDIIPVVISHMHRPELVYGENARTFIDYMKFLNKNLTDDNFIEKTWHEVSRRQLLREVRWLIGTLRRRGVRGVLRRVSYLFGTSENRRWIQGVLMGIIHRLGLTR